MHLLYGAISSHSRCDDAIKVVISRYTDRFIVHRPGQMRELYPFIPKSAHTFLHGHGRVILHLGSTADVVRMDGLL
jgi:hypothetical protein